MKQMRPIHTLVAIYSCPSCWNLVGFAQYVDCVLTKGRPVELSLSPYGELPGAGAERAGAERAPAPRAKIRREYFILVNYETIEIEINECDI
jgi:hypothetical protein